MPIHDAIGASVTVSKFDNFIVESEVIKERLHKVNTTSSKRDDSIPNINRSILKGSRKLNIISKQLLMLDAFRGPGELWESSGRVPGEAFRAF